MQKKYYCSVLLLCASTLTYSQTPLPVAKQLAGSPSEFASMQPVNPINSATHSKSALLPVQLKRSFGDVWSWQSNLPIDGNDLQMLVFSDQSNDWNVHMQGPSALRTQAIDTLAIASREADYGLGGQNYPANYYEFNSLAQGDWQLSINAIEPAQTQGFVLVSNSSPQRILSYQTTSQQLVGERIGFATYTYSDDRSIASISNATLQITAPGRKTVDQYIMFDDGLHNDGRANDGIFGADFIALDAGDYSAQVIVTGTTADKKAFIRTTEHLIPVLEPKLQLSSTTAYASVLNDKRLMINLAIQNRNDNSKYHTYAEVWGSSATNPKQTVPIAWVGGMVTGSNGQLSLGLDARWIAKAGAIAPFELRNIRIEDPDHFIILSEASAITLSMPRLPELATRTFSGIVDTEMLMGPAPLNTVRGAGSKLLLVHGYCSGNVWGPVANQFSNAALFLDLNQNRSHDQFAQRILTFGSNFDSYGIVAHSQGGAAATHLYTFYWSGLDFASGGRLIQSLGTPYQGTALAGNLAVLGNIFGVGCGRNTDLTYSGAANWLASIPAWARGQVNYYSTSFRDRPFRFDHCNIVTDILLADPDDGVTERINAQLPGAINRGHVTNQCHTSGMRDPAQTTDSSRNSIMNANAAR